MNTKLLSKRKDEDEILEKTLNNLKIEMDKKLKDISDNITKINKNVTTLNPLFTGRLN